MSATPKKPAGKLKTKTIRQKALLPATPERVFATLMSSREHGEFTGSPASISKKPGGKFSVYDGWASGKNLSLKPGKLIQQTWTATDWPKGAESQVTIELKRTVKGIETQLTLIHEGVPAEFADDIAKSWEEFYWEPLKKYLK